MTYKNLYSEKQTPQSEPIPGRDMVENRAGGYVFQISPWDHLDRFLILGTDAPTYYASAREMTTEAAAMLRSLATQDGLRMVNRIVEISHSGRAFKNDSALFALAVASKHGNEQTRKLAYGVLPEVARIGTHLFQFVTYREAMGGWGRGMRRAVSRWYNEKPAERLAVQLLKYRQRDGWSHRDILRLAHPVTDSLLHAAMYDVTSRPERLEASDEIIELPRLYEGFMKAQTADKPDASLIEDYGLTWEMLPTEWLKDTEVNRKLAETMPVMATLRNLGRLTANGTLVKLGGTTKLVVERLGNIENLRKARIHPMHLLIALTTYKSGEGVKGSLSWDPIGAITSVLDDMFVPSFDLVEPTDKRYLVGLDVSGSMGWGNIMNTHLTPREAAAAMSMVWLRTEPWVETMAFQNSFVKLPLDKRDSLADVVRRTEALSFGTTDCAQPMLYAKKHGIPVDVFVVLTDNETWSGRVHPTQALRQYRDAMGIDAKLVVVGMTATRCSIADPEDGGMLDVVGFDAAVPRVIEQFVR